MPFELRSDQKIREISSPWNEVLEVKWDLLEIDIHRRIRIMLDVSKPLYERLSHFCFPCGLMNYTDRDCR